MTERVPMTPKGAAKAREELARLRRDTRKAKRAEAKDIAALIAGFRERPRNVKPGSRREFKIARLAARRSRPSEDRGV